jgi:hypothetical protein
MAGDLNPPSVPSVLTSARLSRLGATFTSRRAGTRQQARQRAEGPYYYEMKHHNTCPLRMVSQSTAEGAPDFHFGLSASTFGGVDALVETAVQAEQAGFDSVTVPDLPGALSPLIALAAAARATETIRLGTFVLNTGLWNPATVARDASVSPTTLCAAPHPTSSGPSPPRCEPGAAPSIPQPKGHKR